MPIEQDAREFGHHVKQGGWRLGLLVARSVQPGSGTGRPKKTSATAELSKVSAEAFASRANTSGDRVLRFYGAWEAAADAGHVPHAADLEPGQEIDLDAESLPPWTEFYTTGPSRRNRISEPGATASRPTVRSRTPDAGGFSSSFSRNQLRPRPKPNVINGPWTAWGSAGDSKQAGASPGRRDYWASRARRQARSAKTDASMLDSYMKDDVLAGFTEQDLDDIYAHANAAITLLEGVVQRTSAALAIARDKKRATRGQDQ